MDDHVKCLVSEHGSHAGRKLGIQESSSSLKGLRQNLVYVSVGHLYRFRCMPFGLTKHPPLFSGRWTSYPAASLAGVPHIAGRLDRKHQVIRRSFEEWGHGILHATQSRCFSHFEHRYSGSANKFSPKGTTKNLTNTWQLWKPALWRTHLDYFIKTDACPSTFWSTFRKWHGLQ